MEVKVTLGGVNTDWFGMRRACGDAVAGRWRLNVRHIRPATCARGTGTRNGDRAIARERCRTPLISVNPECKARQAVQDSSHITYNLPRDSSRSKQARLALVIDGGGNDVLPRELVRPSWVCFSLHILARGFSAAQ